MATRWSFGVTIVEGTTLDAPYVRKLQVDTAKMGDRVDITVRSMRITELDVVNVLYNIVLIAVYTEVYKMRLSSPPYLAYSFSLNPRHHENFTVI